MADAAQGLTVANVDGVEYAWVPRLSEWVRVHTFTSKAPSIFYNIPRWWAPAPPPVDQLAATLAICDAPENALLKRRANCTGANALDRILVIGAPVPSSLEPPIVAPARVEPTSPYSYGFRRVAPPPAPAPPPVAPPPAPAPPPFVPTAPPVVVPSSPYAHTFTPTTAGAGGAAGGALAAGAALWLFARRRRRRG